MKICFFGSSLVSSYWNGAATYYRGILKALAARGYEIVFFEPDAFERQSHRDIPDPPWARVIVYPATPDGWQRSLETAARSADFLVKASGLGIFDDELESAIVEIPTHALKVYWDVDAPATLDSIASVPSHHLRIAIPHYDFVFTYGGGDPVVNAYRGLARETASQSTMLSIRIIISLCRWMGITPATSDFSAIVCPIGKLALMSFS